MNHDDQTPGRIVPSSFGAYNTRQHVSLLAGTVGGVSNAMALAVSVT